jgi:hypothetical protein
MTTMNEPTEEQQREFRAYLASIGISNREEAQRYVDAIEMPRFPWGLMLGAIVFLAANLALLASVVAV